MPHSPVTTIKELRIATIEMAHAATKGRFACLDHQVIVIAHEAIGVAAPGVTIDTLCK